MRFRDFGPKGVSTIDLKGEHKWFSNEVRSTRVEQKSIKFDPQVEFSL